MSIDKLDLQTPDLVNANFEKLAELFPNCVTETANGKAIDFDMLKQELSHAVIEGNKERYRLEWPGKREAIVTANLPTTKTLRPLREDSVDFDNTENIYIEGDNLEVLKLLQESYLGKIKMIYIDPPYNTGKDFVYKDNFTGDKETELFESGQKDEYNQRLVVNPETAGRYHSDWLSMMYPRLKLARNLLKDEGAIFISLDDHEIQNLRKVCDEIFGEINFVAMIANINNPKGRSDDKYIATAHEYIAIYAKSIDYFDSYGFEPDEKITKRYNKADDNGSEYREIDLRKTGDNDLREDRPNLFYYFLYNKDNGEFYPTKDDIVPKGYVQIKPIRQDGKEGNWRWGFNTTIENINKLMPKFMPNRQIWGVFEKDYLDNRELVKPTSAWTFKDVNSERGSESFINLGFDKKIFPKPKPVGTVRRTLEVCSTTNQQDIILDFFSGSATTAESVMELNAENTTGNRKYILVQLPELTSEDSEAYKAGYKNICEIGKERIRRASKKIKEETGADIDYGFRVYRLDESNMQDVYYKPQDYKQEAMDLFADNVKPDRTADDLLAQVMLDWGLPLSLKIEQNIIAGKQVFKVAEDSLYACFDKGIDEDFAKAIAQDAPLRIVFRDNGFTNDTAKTNVKQLLKQLSPETEMKVI
jgi:adenine-specific DNA-methyltransferase